MTSKKTDAISRRTVLRTSAGGALSAGLVGFSSSVSAQEQDCDRLHVNDGRGEITVEDSRLPMVLEAERRCVPDSAPTSCTVTDATLAGPDTDSFSLQVPSLPATMEPGECFEANLQFDPTSPGDKEVIVTVQGECGGQSDNICTLVTATVSSAEDDSSGDSPSTEDPPEDTPEESTDDPSEDTAEDSSEETSEESSVDQSEETAEESSVDQSQETTEESLEEVPEDLLEDMPNLPENPGEAARDRAMQREADARERAMQRIAEARERIQDLLDDV